MAIAVVGHGTCCPTCQSTELEISGHRKAFFCRACSTYFAWDLKFKQTIWNLTNGHCVYCGIKMLSVEESRLPRFNRATTRFTIDHFIPYEQGGDNVLSNLVPCCTRCNNSKGRKLPQAFMVEKAKKKV